MGSYRLYLQFFLAMMAIFASIGAETSASAAPPTKDEIQQAWVRRHASIQSIDASYSITDSRPGRKQPHADPNNPFREFVTPNDTSLKQTYTFEFKQGRIASKVDGDAIFQDGTVGRQMNAAAFDGKEYRTMLQGRNQPMGSFDRRGRAGDQLTRGFHNLAIWLWFDPNQLMENVVWDVGTMKVSKDRHTVRNTNCWQIELSRKSPDWVSHVYVDDSKDYLPLRWESIFKGKLSSRFDIDYQNDANGHSFVSKWVAVLHSGNGELRSTTLAEVQRFQINQPIDDQTFELEFPVGTQLVEERDGAPRYFIQQKTGMRRIEAGDFGSTQTLPKRVRELRNTD